MVICWRSLRILITGWTIRNSRNNMIAIFKVSYMEKINHIKSQLDLKDSLLLKCSSILKLLTKSTDNQLMHWLINVFNFVPLIPEENFMLTLLSVEVPLYSRDLRKDWNQGFKNELTNDFLSSKIFQMLK